MVMILAFLRRLLAGLLSSFLLRGHRAHHLSCRTGPLGRAYLAKNTGLLRQSCLRWSRGREAGRAMLTTFNSHWICCPVSGDHHFVGI